MANRINKRNDENKLSAPKKLKILFTIVEREKGNFYMDILQGFDVSYQTIFYGRGTAPSEIGNLLGLASSDKAVIMSVVKEESVKEILNSFEDKYFKLKHGRGIAFTIPLSSMIGKVAYQYLANLKGDMF